MDFDWIKDCFLLRNRQNEVIGRVGLEFVAIFGTMPETLMEDMVGRKLVDVISHPSFCPNVCITFAENRRHRDHYRWGEQPTFTPATFIYTEGYPIPGFEISLHGRSSDVRIAMTDAT